MQFSALTSILLALSAIGVSPVTAAEDIEWVCETSGGSPYLHHVNQLIDNLKNAPIGENVCVWAADHCTKTIKKYSGEKGGAVFQMCGEAGKGQGGLFRCAMSPSGAPCAGANCGGRPARAIAGYLEQLRDRCVARPDGQGERVGGIAKFSVPGLDGGQIKLYTMPG